MKRSGGVTVAAIALICAGVSVVLFGLLAILVEATIPSLPAARYDSVGAEILKPVNADDLSKYLDGPIDVLHENWRRALAQSGMLNVRGGVTIDVSISHSGELAAKPVPVESQNNTPQLIKPALAATEKSAPFETLPKTFAGAEVDIRVFFTNEPPEDAPKASVAPKIPSKLLLIVIAGWGIATGIGILRLRRWAWVSMILSAALLIGIAFTPVPRAMKLIRETTGIPTIGAPGFIGMAYAEMAVRMLVPLALGLWWVLVFLRKSVWEQFSGAATARAGAAAGDLSILSAQGIQQQDAPEMGLTSQAGERAASSAEPSAQGRIARSGGVTAAAIVLFFGSGLLLLMMGLGSLVLVLPRPTNADQNFPVASLVVGLLFYGLFAAWGIVTAVGILKLRQWARISILVMSGFAVMGILFAFLAILLVAPMMQQTPGVDPGLGKVIEVIWGVVLAIPLGISIWWFVLFMLKGVRLQFATGGLPASAVLAPPPLATPSVPDASGTGAVSAAIHSESAQVGSAQRKIPVSIIVIAIFLLLGPAGIAYTLTFSIQMHIQIPTIFLGIFLTGWKSVTVLGTMGIVELVLGIALLRKKAWSLDATVGFVIFATLNGLTFFIPSARERYFSALTNNYPVPQGLPPDFMAHMMHVFLPVGMIFGIALNIVALYFLWTRRGAYRAACAGASASDGGARPGAPQ